MRKTVCVAALLLAVVLLLNACIPSTPTPAPRVEISLSEAVVKVGESIELSATSTNGETILWTSANEGVATVSDGIVFGIEEGEVVITASTRTALATCLVRVVGGNPPEDDPSTDPNPDPSHGLEGLTLVWSDEFSGSELDRSKWGFQIGVRDEYHGKLGNTWYWGNDELQYYTEDSVSVSDGVLTITASRRDYEGMEYTSARILTRDLASFTYGYFEARIKLPASRGMWPAFWMMPQPSDPSSTRNEYGGWSASGEIDIMEARGRIPGEIGNALHYGGKPHVYSADSERLDAPISEWHTYGLDWTADYIIWYVDGKESFRVTSDQWWTSASNGSSAPFDKPFYLILNLAVGGNYDGGVKPSDDFESASMLVDYVRVYSHD
jgi:beta-glucanase (GH16 family)